MTRQPTTPRHAASTPHISEVSFHELRVIRIFRFFFFANIDIQVLLHIRLGLPKVKIGSLFSAQFSSRFIKLLWTSVPNSHSNVKASVS
jgi:hypothetical protein